MSTYSQEELEKIARRAAEGHATRGHVEKRNDFKNPELGPPLPVDDEKDLARHVVEVLKSEETWSAEIYAQAEQERHAVLLYHPPSNTIVIIPQNPEDELTAYRPGTGDKVFLSKIDDAQVSEKREIDVEKGISRVYPMLVTWEQERQRQEKLEKIREEMRKSWEEAKQSEKDKGFER